MIRFQEKETQKTERSLTISVKLFVLETRFYQEKPETNFVLKKIIQTKLSIQILFLKH